MGLSGPIRLSLKRDRWLFLMTSEVISHLPPVHICAPAHTSVATHEHAHAHKKGFRSYKRKGSSSEKRVKQWVWELESN